MIQKLKKLSLEQQLFISFLSLSCFLLLFSLSIAFIFSSAWKRKDIDKSLKATASYIASMDQIASMLQLGYPDESVRRELDFLSENFPDINIIAVYNTEGLRFYHTDRHETGETYMDGEEAAVLAGSPPYITVGYGTFGAQRRAYHSIRSQDDSIIGYVTVSAFTNYISEQAGAFIPTYILVGVLMFFVSLLLTHAVVRALRSSLMGHHPQELLDLYIRQDTVLNAMEEGLIASDQKGIVVFANQSAKTIFSEKGELTGKPLKEIFPESLVHTILQYGAASYHRSCTTAQKRLLVSELPFENGGSVQGVLTVVNDRTELDTVIDELSGARSMLDTLRAFNHEFLNKLHVILGYLQTGQTQAAITFIINSNLVSSQAIRQTADCIRCSPICALVIGKMMHAAELEILLTVNPDSRCTEKELLLPADAVITITGNLLENAIEELSSHDHPVREIHFGIYCTGDCNLITCEDTGGGIPKELLEHIYDKGVTSKGENRGTGLYLIRQVTDQYGGDISIETEAGEGTCFTITFTRKEHQECTE